MIYDTYKFLQPPIPKTAVPSHRLINYEGRGWVAQAKLNGTYNVVTVTPDRHLVAATREGSLHKQWRFDGDSAKAFESIPGKGWYVFCCELMHSKTRHIKNTNYIHDILVADSKAMFGKTYPERHAILRALFPTTDKFEYGWIIDDHTWLAGIETRDFSDLFRKLSWNKECEGLVLKQVDTKLVMSNVNAGQVKCRKPTKLYTF